ncbi:MAG TPA: type II/IV secretion system protein [bacterium]|nr:type II/IV secretion system protein [bacterium]
MLYLPEEKLKKVLIEGGFLTEKEFENYKKKAERLESDIGEILISEGVITLDYYYQLLSDYYKIPLAKSLSKKIDPKILSFIPEIVARERKAVAFDFDEKNNLLKVAMSDPTDIQTIEYLERLTGKKIEPYLETEQNLERLLSIYAEQSTVQFEEVVRKSVQAASRMKVRGLEEAAKELPIVQLLDALIYYAIFSEASDIHIEPLEKEILVRFRIEGLLREIARFPKEILDPLVARIKLLSSLKIDVHYIPQDGRFRFTTKTGQVVDLRVSIMPQLHGEKVVMRLLRATRPLSLPELGLLKSSLEKVKKAISRSFGSIFICGPTGSGKTTTLYSILSILNRPEVNIVTIEDPIEYAIKYVNQIQVNPQAGLTFATGLRSILREDPDIILVGEIRDKETAEIATHAALTGHLLFSTLHTNDAPTAVPRLIEMGVPKFLVAATLNTVIAQRLVRKICKNCIYSYKPKKSEIDAIKEQLLILGVKEEEIEIPRLFFRGKGCPICHGSGYKGRTGIFEILDINDQLREMIGAEGFDLEAFKKVARQAGYRTMFEDGLKKMELGITTLEEVLRAVRE